MAGTPEDARVLSAMIDQFISRRTISQYQYRQLSRMVLADGSIDEFERQQINRLHDAIREGFVKVSD